SSFFSSRRRHTSFSRDWSSDVCSSDLFFHHLDNVAELMVLLEAPALPIINLVSIFAIGLNNHFQDIERGRTMPGAERIPLNFCEKGLRMCCRSLVRVFVNIRKFLTRANQCHTKDCDTYR